MRQPNNFARIDFTANECAAIIEISRFFRELSQDTAAKHRFMQAPLSRMELDTMRRAIQRGVEAISRKKENGSFFEVDLTKDVCDALADGAEFIAELLRDEFKAGKTNPRAQVFHVVLGGVKMKTRAASTIIKPDIATDLRLH